MVIPSAHFCYLYRFPVSKSLGRKGDRRPAGAGQGAVAGMGLPAAASDGGGHLSGSSSQKGSGGQAASRPGEGAGQAEWPAGGEPSPGTLARPCAAAGLPSVCVRPNRRAPGGRIPAPGSSHAALPFLPNFLSSLPLFLSSFFSLFLSPPPPTPLPPSLLAFHHFYFPFIFRAQLPKGHYCPLVLYRWKDSVAGISAHLVGSRRPCRREQL